MRKVGLVLCISALMVSQSCNSLLEVEPSNNLSGDVFADQEDIQNALTGAYFNLGGINDGIDGGELFGGDFILIPTLLMVENTLEMNWDDVNGASYTDFFDKNIQAVNARVESNWRRAYEVINTLNSILMSIDNVTDPNAKSRIQGEALAMRGILYFEMVRLWGYEYELGETSDSLAIPLMRGPVEEPGAFPTDSVKTVGEIYDQVQSDLENASDLLMSFGTNGTRLSYYACQAYLMRKALHETNYPLAIVHAENIIGDNAYSLTSSPLGAFNNETNSVEDIFAIQQTQANNAGNISNGTGITNFYSSLSGQGLGALRIGQIYLNDQLEIFDFSPEFDSTDLRWGIDSLTSNSTASDITSGFYVNILNTTQLSPSKYAAADRVIPVIRYAEVLLARAEALAVQSPVTVDATALADYNAIRTRAGLTALDASDFGLGLELYDSILVEKRREFFYEGHLLHDMRRIADDDSPLKEANLILPIPQSELDAGAEN